jgi:hypothetical protein
MRSIACLAAAVFASALPAFSGLIVNNTTVLCNSGNTSCSTLASQSTTLNYSKTLTSDGNSISVTAFASENLSTGALMASDSYSEPSAESFYTQFNSEAQLSDTFSINAPGLAGTVGYLEMSFVLDGTTSVVDGTTIPNGQAEIAAMLSDPAGANTDGCPSTSANCYVSGDGSVVTLPMPFHYGTPFTLFWVLGAITYPGPGSLTGSADYSHTATPAIEVFNSASQPVYDATVVASGGEQIPSLTPEPGSAVLLGLGLALIIVFLSRRAKADV